MTTEVDNNNFIQALADSSGVILDRAITPEKILGQAWLISKSRVITCASTVANYAEAPWALTVKFPFPGVTLAVKNITLHSEYNKREARNYYLAQAHGPGTPQPQLENDIAMLTLDSDLTLPAAERIAEINSALTLPIDLGAKDLSGVIRPGDLQSIIQSALLSGHSGLLSLMDARNVPFARISVRQNNIVKAVYGKLTNERAVLELLYQRPSGNFVFQAQDQFAWGNLPDIAAPAEQLKNEINRRLQEIPQVLQALGGPETRLQTTKPQLDLSCVSQQNQWFAEQLWGYLNGYNKLTELSSCVPTDTYSILKALWELKNAGLVRPNENNPFHNKGQLSPTLVPAAETDLCTWDNLTVFYLGMPGLAPTTVPGNFFGMTHIFNPRMLLHTAPVPADVRNAIVLKGSKLVGIHNGQFGRLPLQSPPVTLSIMTWIGALPDTGGKQLKTAMLGEPGHIETEKQDISLQRGSMAGRLIHEPEGQTDEGIPPEEGFLARFTKKQLAIAGAALGSFALILLLVLTFSRGQAPTTPNTNVATIPSTSTQIATNTPVTPPLTAAINNAVKYAGFPSTPPPGYTYEDSANLTKSLPSFVLKSVQENKQLVFALYPNTRPVDSLDYFIKRLPFYDYTYPPETKTIERGYTNKIRWMRGEWRTAKDEPVPAVIAAFVCPTDQSKSILVIATPLSGTTINPELTISLIDGLLYQSMSKIASSSQTEQTYASTAQLTEYCKKVETLIKAAFKAPKNKEDAVGPASLEFTVDSKGAITSIEMKEIATDSLTQALQKVVSSTAPYPPPPLTKEHSVTMLVTASNGTISVEAPAN